jgi:hypothetical protein
MELKLTEGQTRTFSEILANLGQIFFASTVVPFLLPDLVTGKLHVAFFGLAIALVCWITSLMLARDI